MPSAASPATAASPVAGPVAPPDLAGFRPRALRTLDTDTPVTAAISASVLPCPSSPRIAVTTSAVSFDARRGPLRAGTSPATPPPASA